MNAKWLGWALCLAPVFAHAQISQDSEVVVPVERFDASPVDSAMQRTHAAASDRRSPKAAASPRSSAAASPTCLTDTTQSDFQSGTAVNVDVNSSPGNVVLLNADHLDQQNTTLGTSGVGITTTTYGGQTFTPSISGRLTHVDINLFCSGCTGTTPNLTLGLRATSGGLPTGADIAAATVPGFSSGAAVFYTATFGTPPTLVAGTQYALVIHPTVNPSPGTYALTRSGTATAGSNVYAGGTRVAGATSGTVWSIPLTGGVSTDAGFRIYINDGYDASGELDSSVKDANPLPSANVTWTTLSWNAAAPTNTAVQFQIAGSASSGGPFNFVGPDNTPATYFNSGDSLSLFNGLRYLKYRAVLSTTDSTVTPTLNDVTVCYADLGPSDLAISVDDGVAAAIPGGSVTYSITASNAGPADAGGASVSDVFPAAETCTWTCAGAGGGTCTASGSGNVNDTVNLPAGGSVTYTASCAISPAATGILSNTATVAAPAGITDPTPGNNSANDTDTLAPMADLAITKTDGMTTATPGGSVTYTITASNAGPSDAPGAAVADTFPASETCTWTCVGAGGGTCTASGSGNVNDTVNLPAGGSVTYTASCAISSAATGSLSNTATVAAPAGVTDPAPGNNSANDTDTLSASADLSITNTDGVAAVTAGGSTTYTIVAHNGGPSNAVGATVNDIFPAGETCTWTCAGAGGGTCTASGSGNIADTINLPSGASASYSAVCSISFSASGTLNNTAAITAPAGVTDATPGNNSVTDGDSVNPAPAASLSATETVGAAGGFRRGTNAIYTVVLHNGGSGAQGDNPGDEFVDPLDPALAFVSANATSGTATFGGGAVHWNGSIPAGGNVTITIVATIGNAATGTISNQGTLSWDSNGDGTNDATGLTDDPSLPGTADPTTFAVAASLSQTAVVSSVNPSTFGQSVTFTATVSAAAPPPVLPTTAPVAGRPIAAAASAPVTVIPTGTVTFLDGSNPIGTGTLSGGVATFATSTLVVGNHPITASYGGDGNFNSSTGSLTGNPQVVVKAAQTITFTSAPPPNPVAEGTYTVTATASSGLTVAFSIDAASTANTCTIAGSVVSFTGTGNCIVDANQAGNANYAAAPTAQQTVAVGKTISSVAVQSSLNPSVFGQSVTFTATVSGQTPGGTVTFTSGAATLCGTVTLSGGTATCTTAALPVGNDTLAAAYSGDGNNAAASATLVQTVNLKSTTVSLAATPNPATAGQAVTLIATVAGDPPTGSVVFTDNGTALPCSPVTLVPGTTSATAACTAMFAAGSHTIAAAYSGDAGFAAATSTTLVVTVNAAAQTAVPAPAFDRWAVLLLGGLISMFSLQRLRRT